MDKKIAEFSANDLGVAPVTPFKEDGEVNYDVFEDVAKYLQKTHIELIFVNGTLGEGMNMTVEERKLTAEKWMDVARGRIPHISVHVGCANLKDSLELARHAESIGADFIAAVSPTYYKPDGVDSMVEYMSHIAGAAPSTPFYYYDFDTQTGIKIDCEKFLKVGSPKIPNLRGMKYTSYDPMNWHWCSTMDGGKFDVLAGTIDEYLACLAMGIPKVITLPFFGESFNDIRTHFDAGDITLARKSQIRHLELLKLLEKFGHNNMTFKAAFSAFSGIEMGPVRLPMKDLSPGDKRRLTDELRNAWFIA